MCFLCIFLREKILFVLFIHEMVSGLCGWQGGGTQSGGTTKIHMRETNRALSLSKDKVTLKAFKEWKKNTDLYGIKCSRLSATLE